MLSRRSQQASSPETVSTRRCAVGRICRAALQNTARYRSDLVFRSAICGKERCQRGGPAFGRRSGCGACREGRIHRGAAAGDSGAAEQRHQESVQRCSSGWEGSRISPRGGLRKRTAPRSGGKSSELDARCRNPARARSR